MDNNEILETGLTLDEVAKHFPLVRKNPDDPGARITTTFCITGDPLNFAECTEAVGMEPTSIQEKRTRGRWLPSGRPNILPAEWCLEVIHEPSYDVDQCVTELLDLIFPRVEQIKALLTREPYSAGFLTCVTVFEDRPIYSLSASNIKRLAAFNLSWDLDIQ